MFFQIVSSKLAQSGSINQVSRHKFQLPRAVDSVHLELDVPQGRESSLLGLQELQTHQKQMYSQQQVSQAQHPGASDPLVNSRGTKPGDYDKFAAYLAARIRTKAELKQVSPDIEQLSPSTSSLAQLPPLDGSYSSNVGQSSLDAINVPHGEAMISVGSPPKLTREHGLLTLQRHKMSATSEEGPVTGSTAVLSPSVAALHHSLGFRSSSEVSVFDFPDTDSEGEMPVLERQTLYEMRRDRKLLKPNGKGTDVEIASTRDESCSTPDLQENANLFVQGPLSPSDAFWTQTCDQFLEQLQAGTGPVQKRGRKKKIFDMVFDGAIEKLAAKDNSLEGMKEDLMTDSGEMEINDEGNMLFGVHPTKTKQEISAEINSFEENEEGREGNTDCSVKTKSEEKVSEEPLASDLVVIKLEKEVVTDNEMGEISDCERLTVPKKICKEERVLKSVSESSRHEDDNQNTDDSRRLKKFICKEEKDLASKENDSGLPIRRRKRKRRKHINREIGSRKGNDFIEGQIEKRTFRNGTIKVSQEIDLRGKRKGKRIFKSCAKFHEKKFLRKLKSSKEGTEQDLYSTKPSSKVSVNKEERDVDDEISLAEMKARLRRGRPRTKPSVNRTVNNSANDAELISSSSCESGDSSSDGVPQESVAARVHRRKGCKAVRTGMRLRPRNTSLVAKKRKLRTQFPDNSKKNSPASLAEAKQFSDGSFHPGWEEEVYKFKQSLRMPAQLINIPKPPGARHLSGSLPDLDQSSTLLGCTNIKSSSNQHQTVHSDLNSQSTSNSLDSIVNRKLDCGIESENTNVKSSQAKNHLKGNEDISSLKDFSDIHSKTSNRKAVLRKKFGKSSFVLRSSSSDNESSHSEVSRLQENSSKLKKAENMKGKVKLSMGKKEGRVDTACKDICKKKTHASNVFCGNSKITNGNHMFEARTRTQTRLMQQKPTILAVFGEDRPASAPPSCDAFSENKRATKLKVIHNSVGVVTRGRAGLRSAAVLRSNKAVLKSKRHLLHSNKNRNVNMILRTVSHKKSSGDGVNVYSSEPVVVLPQMLQGTISNKSLANPPLRKRIKIRTVRRKFRSGFDYIRKKKKQQKKDCDMEPVKERKKAIISRPSSESVQDIQAEIRGWVINKGLGETLLHRAARLGYTDVAAYCLEKMDNAPSPQDNAGYTPLHEACSRGHLDIARLLLMYGADVSASALGGVRPLHEAAENGYTELVRLLLSYGADPLLATYSGVAPLALATDEGSRRLLQYHLADVQGLSATSWTFHGSASVADPVLSGYDPLQDAPCASPESGEDDEIDIEISDVSLPVLYQLRGESVKERWVLFQDLALLLRIKSRDVLLRQICPGPGADLKSVLRELKMADFLQQAHCCHVLGGGEKVNIRASKVALVKYNDKVRELLGVEKVTLSTR